MDHWRSCKYYFLPVALNGSGKSFFFFFRKVMGCGDLEAAGLSFCLFCCYQPSVLSGQQS